MTNRLFYLGTVGEMNRKEMKALENELVSAIHLLHNLKHPLLLPMTKKLIIDNINRLIELKEWQFKFIEDKTKPIVKLKNGEIKKIDEC